MIMPFHRLIVISFSLSRPHETVPSEAPPFCPSSNSSNSLKLLGITTLIIIIKESLNKWFVSFLLVNFLYFHHLLLPFSHSIQYLIKIKKNLFWTIRLEKKKKALIYHVNKKLKMHRIILIIWFIIFIFSQKKKKENYCVRYIYTWNIYKERMLSTISKKLNLHMH